MGFMGSRTLGVDFSRVDAAQEFTLGAREGDEAGREYVYCQANGAVTAAVPVSIASGYQAAPSGNAGTVFGVCVATLADNEYGWIQVRGLVTAEVAGSTAAGARIDPLADTNGDLVTNAGATDPDIGWVQTAESGGQSAVYLR